MQSMFWYCGGEKNIWEAMIRHKNVEVKDWKETRKTGIAGRGHCYWSRTIILWTMGHEHLHFLTHQDLKELPSARYPFMLRWHIIKVIIYTYNYIKATASFRGHSEGTILDKVYLIMISYFWNFLSMSLFFFNPPSPIH